MIIVWRSNRTGLIQAVQFDLGHRDDKRKFDKIKNDLTPHAGRVVLDPWCFEDEPTMKACGFNVGVISASQIDG